jgi:hypothetical protein
MQRIAKIIVFALYAAVLTFSGSAHAKRGLLIFNTGDELFEVSSYQAASQLSPVKIGYKCSHFGLFWADVWTWDCTMVEYLSDNAYADLPEQLRSELQNNSQYKLSKAKRGFWNHYAFWVLVSLIGLLSYWAYRQKVKVDAEAERLDKIEAFKLRQQMRSETQPAAPGAESPG